MEGEQTVGQNQKNAQEPDMNQLRKVRRDKLAELQQNGRDPFQITKFDQTHHSLEVKDLYEAHEAELLKDHQTPNVEGMDEEQAKEALKKDYEERRSIMDANPIHVAIAGRMMFKRVMEKLLSVISRIYREISRYMLPEMQSEQNLMLILRNLISVIFSDWKDLLSEQEQEKSPSMQRR